MRAREFTEALDQPYYLHWEHSTDGDVSAVAELPANEGHVHILFEPHRDNKDGSVAWGVEFWRNDSQDITGEGDQFRVFATVLQAVSEFVAKYKPMNLSFQATKKVEPWQKSMSRANLYDRLVQRYARASGYRAFRADAGNNVHYELVKINKGVSEAIKPSDRLQASILYHGTPMKDGYQGIVGQGLKVNPELIAQKYKGQENFAPLPGVYMTTEFGNAVRYSFMSEVPDEKYAEYIKQEPYGYVFEFSGNDLSNVTPDEDELGNFLKQLVNSKNLQTNLLKIVQSVPEELRIKLQQPRVDFETIALAGKWVVNNISDSTMQYLMKRYHNVVNYGSIKPTAVWVIPKPNERFLRDRQGTFNTFNGYINYAKRFGKRHDLSNKQGVAEGTMKDLDHDIQDQQWDAIVGYVVNGVKKGMDTDRMELALYKWASRELVDVEQALEDHGFRDIADLADHIEQHNGRYVPPSDFGLGNLGRGVAEHNLQELGTTQYKVTEPRDMVNVDFRTKQITYKVFKFKVDKQVFLIVLTVKDQAMPGSKKKVPTLNVAFGRQDKNGWDVDDIDTNLTGDNQNQFQIYSTVVKTIQKFITELNPNVAQIIIKGDNERQQMTYEKFFKSRYLEKYLPGFSYNPKSRTLIRNGIKLEPEQIEVKTQK
jgi:hypothetical protein